jgi:hypothetical protein
MNAPLTATASDYLDRLAAALADAPAGLRDDIVTGIREELVGLDDTATALRIAALGDPARIAAEALDQLPAASPRPPVAYLIVTVALIVIGGWLIPVLGWIAGLVMAVGSPEWSPRDKRIAVGIAVGSAALATLLLFLLRGAEWGLLALVLFGAISFIGNAAAGIRLIRAWYRPAD